jgi:hypothetical protein
MTTPLISLKCRYCGQSLTGAVDEPGAQPGPDTVLSCPIHGPIGPLKDLVIAAAEEFASEERHANERGG